MILRGRAWLLALAGALALLGAAGWFVGGWYLGGPLEKDANFSVPEGAGLASIASLLEEQGIVSSSDGFRLRARVLGGFGTIKAGEFAIPAGASPSQVLDILHSGKVVRRLVTVPEGMPSILVWERLKANPLLTGELPVPREGSLLPDSYDFARGESRAALVARMQSAMDRTLAELWAKRSPSSVVKTPQEALVLASIVEKETGKPSERRMVAGLYSNRLRIGMPLQADPTIIYPITRGKPLGRRIKQSEIAAINDYNTYSMTGLPKGPITNPGRESIAAVLNPAKTDALYMVADGTGGHQFSSTLEQHNAAVAKWFALRRAKGEM